MRPFSQEITRTQKIYFDDIIDYEEYREHFDAYSSRSDVAIAVDYKGKQMMLPFIGFISLSQDSRKRQYKNVCPIFFQEFCQIEK